MMYTVEEYSRALTECFAANKNATFKRVEVYGSFEPGIYKFTGAVFTGSAIVGIPNSGTSIIMANPYFEQTGDKPFELFEGDYEPEPFGYTGGVFYNSKVYALPRRANAILEIDAGRKTASRVPLSISYSFPGQYDFHHYAGVKSGHYVYCAPKKSRRILVIDLSAVAARNSVNCRELEVPGIENQSYHGGVLHPNGLIYFNPAAESRVMALDPQTEETMFIGNPSPQTVFKSMIMPGGKIYGAGYDGGILLTDTGKKTTRYISNDSANPETYGAMLGFNGKMYSYISTGTALVEFDPLDESFRVVQAVNDGKYNYAKCAACCLAPDGSIWQLPAFGRFIYRITFDGVKGGIAPEILTQPCFSGY